MDLRPEAWLDLTHTAHPALFLYDEPVWQAIARIADEGSWESPAKGALFFHARYVSPGWRLTRVAQVQNHIFYR